MTTTTTTTDMPSPSLVRRHPAKVSFAVILASLASSGGPSSYAQAFHVPPPLPSGYSVDRVIRTIAPRISSAGGVGVRLRVGGTPASGGLPVVTSPRGVPRPLAASSVADLSWIDALRVDEIGDVAVSAEEVESSPGVSRGEGGDAEELGRVRAAVTKVGMLTFIAGMCVALPLSLIPPAVLGKARVIDRVRRERLSLRAGQFCARWMLRLVPFAAVEVMHHRSTANRSEGGKRVAGWRNRNKEKVEEPTVWVCNHTSMLDVFFLLASSKRLGVARPIKIVYWKDLEKNPVTRVLFKMCGFIPVEMEANKQGEANNYDRSSFRDLLKRAKQAFDEGFDLGILPEGQLNPSPEDGPLPVFTGAYTLSKMSRRPIRMMALNGPHRLWHPDEERGMTVTGRRVRVRMYPEGRTFESGEEFAETFAAVVGHFGARGTDLPGEDLTGWLDGTKWESRKGLLAEEEEVGGDGVEVDGVGGAVLAKQVA